MTGHEIIGGVGSAFIVVCHDGNGGREFPVRDDPDGTIFHEFTSHDGTRHRHDLGEIDPVWCLYE